MKEEFLQKGKSVQATRKDIKGDVNVKLLAFQRSLKDNQKTKPVKKPIAMLKSDVECTLHLIKNCGSCRDTFGEIIESDDDDWMNASLKFDKEVGANVYQPKVDDYTVIDPRQGAKADPFGRDIQVLGDIKGKQKLHWTEKSTRSLLEQDGSRL
jgi:peptidyl-prolyl cis-trans isomerase SDCCAG10